MGSLISLVPARGERALSSEHANGEDIFPKVRISLI